MGMINMFVVSYFGVLFSLFYSLELISNSCSSHTALCDMIHAVIYWPPTYLHY